MYLIVVDQVGEKRKSISIWKWPQKLQR